MLHAVVFFMPATTASRTTQSKPNINKSSASRSSVHTHTRFGFAPNSVTVLIACGNECHGVVGGPPRRKIHNPASRKSSAMSRSIDSWVSVMPLAAPAATNSRP